MVPPYHLSIETPTPLVLGVGGYVCASDMFCDFWAIESATQWERFVRRVLAWRKTSSRPSGSVPLCATDFPSRGNFFGSFASWSSSSSSSLPLGGQGKREGSQGAPGVLSGGASSPPPLDFGSSGEGWRCLWAVVWGAAGALPLLLLLRERAKWGLPARCGLPFFRASDFVVSPQFSPHVPRRENSRETS